MLHIRCNVLQARSQVCQTGSHVSETAVQIHKQKSSIPLWKTPHTKNTMSQPNYAHAILQEPSKSPQGSVHSAETNSIHDPDSLPLLIQYQTGALHSPTTGHAFIYLPTSLPITLPLLTKTAIQALRETHNPNNSQMIPGNAIVKRLIVHWGVPAQRPSGLAFPSTTQLSDENLAVVLSYMRRGRGYDFVEIRFEEPVAHPTSASVSFAPASRVIPDRSVDRKTEQGGSAKGAGKSFKVMPKLDYSL